MSTANSLLMSFSAIDTLRVVLRLSLALLAAGSLLATGCQTSCCGPYDYCSPVMQCGPCDPCHRVGSRWTGGEYYAEASAVPEPLPEPIESEPLPSPSDRGEPADGNAPGERGSGGPSSWRRPRTQMVAWPAAGQRRAGRMWEAAGQPQLSPAPRGRTSAHSRP